MQSASSLCQTKGAMADFSFSFDSDNPFAEPEQTPKKATPTDETPAPAADVAGDMAAAPQLASAPAPTDDEFSLDSFDFAFGEDAAINDSLPTRNTPLDEAPPRQLTPGEAAFAEFDFGAPKAETSKIEPPIAEVETPEIETPEIEPPIVEVPVAEIETSEIETSEIETPVAEVEMPEIETSEVPVAELEAPRLSPLEKITVSLKTSERTARSDLEEFNAFTYDFGPPADDAFEAETVIDESSVSFGDAKMTGEEPVVQVPFAQPPVEEPAFAESAFAEPAFEESLGEAPDTSLNHAVSDAVAASAFEDETQGQTEGEFRRLKTKAILNVAILGASGIGKNHARWFHRHGCQVVGFLGTSEDSTAQTETDLNAQFDFTGRAYTDLETLLQTEKPDIVCVATPPPLHFGHVLQSLEAGAHVLCEKPLVYAPTRKFRENRDGAKELVKVAAKRNLNLGTQLQYGGATPILCKLAGLSPSDVGDFAMEIETVNPNSPRDPRELWIDLGPHPVSVAQMLAGANAHLAEETIVFEPHQDDEKTEVLARFGINCADGRLLMVRAVVRALRGENPRKPRRRFSFNGHAVTYAPLQSAKNGFQAQFVAPDGYASVYPDPVDYLIGNFVNACRYGQAPMISGDFGRENLEWMLKISTPGETR